MPGPVVPLPPLLSLPEFGVRGAGLGGGGLPWSQRFTNRLTANSPRSEGEGALTWVRTMGAGSEQVLPAVQDGEILTRIARAPCIHCFSPERPVARYLVCVACAQQETSGSLVGPEMLLAFSLSSSRCEHVVFLSSLFTVRF